MLGELGYDAGRADGLPGPRTYRSIRSFQRDQGLVIDGRYSEPLLAQLNLRLTEVRKKRGIAGNDVRASAVGLDPKIKELQRMLGELGYDSGRPDGFLGSKTHKSISAFQRDHGVEIDGQYSEELLARLRSRLAGVRQEGSLVFANVQAEPRFLESPGVTESGC